MSLNVVTFSRGTGLAFVMRDNSSLGQYLVKYGPKELLSRITNAKPVPLENVTTFRDIEDEITDFVRNGFKKRFSNRFR